MNCKSKIDAAVQRIIQCLKDECTIVPSPGWLMDDTIRTELALIEQESTHLIESLTQVMDELCVREREYAVSVLHAVTVHGVPPYPMHSDSV